MISPPGIRINATVRMAATLVLLFLLFLFAYQNMAEVELMILGQTMQTRRIVVIGLSFALGYAVCWINARK